MIESPLHADDGCLICDHVLKDGRELTFVGRTQDGWVAACNEDCTSYDSGEGLSLVHLTHLTSFGAPKDIFSLPVNFRLDKKLHSWNLNYFDNGFEPHEGLFAAAPENSPFRRLTISTQVYACGSASTPMSITLDEGTVVLPFWIEKNRAENFLRTTSNSLDLYSMKFEKLVELARDLKIHYLSPNFLANSFDLAILTSQN